LVEHVTPSSPAYQETLRTMTRYFAEKGATTADAQAQAAAWIGQQVQTQASFLAYIDVFHVLMLIMLCAIPLALILSNVDLKEGGGSGMH
jgi:DHA2 family multidrug resistance protein